MNISDESIRFLAELFNGDNGNCYVYKSGPKIFKFFNQYFGYSDTYSFGNSYPSRWQITYNKIVDLWNTKRFDTFLSKILSPVYLKTECPESAVDELKKKSESAVFLLNKQFETDGNRVVAFSDGFSLLPINDDEILLGEGGYARCYFIKSKQVVEKRLKEDNYLDEGVISRFKREYDITKSLDDIEGIIKVYSFNEANLSYTMERGECDLYSYVMDNFLDDDFKRNVIYQLCSIMNKVHSRNVIHRDLSPRNIFICSGMLKIADFGLGKDLNAFYSHQTMKTNSVGQYDYCDPRQVKRLKDGDKLSDIYSIGKIIDFVFTKDPNCTSHRYYAVSEKATCADEKHRYQSVAELEDGLRHIDKYVANDEFKKNFMNKIKQGLPLKEEDVSYICSFDEKQMFEMVSNSFFRNTFVKSCEKEIISEKEFLEKTDMLINYLQSSRVNDWKDYDRCGELGINILLSKCSYNEKEAGVRLLNLPLLANRFDIISKTKECIIGNIDPSLEESLKINI